MANDEHVRILKEGAAIWNAWREEHPEIEPDLHGADLKGCPLEEKGLRVADIDKIPVIELNDLMVCELQGANIVITNLRYVNLEGADLSEANLGWTDLRGADLKNANLRNARLDHAHMVDTNLDGAILTGCTVFGISAWNLKGEPLDQSNLIITRRGEPIITVDNLEVAQFIYLLINHKKLRAVIDSVIKKGVLILGPFENGGLEILKSIATKLRESGYLPIIFDFVKPEARNYTETVMTLAGLSRFVIVNLSGPSIPQELYAIVQNFKVPVSPIIEDGKKSYSMFVDLLENDWVLEPTKFSSKEQLNDILLSRIIEPAEKKYKERQRVRSRYFNQ